MLRWLARKTIKPITLRLRWYLQADIMAELAALRTQLGMAAQTSHNIDNLTHSIENALLTLALLGGGGQQGQGGFAPLDPPLRAQPLEPNPVREERGHPGTGV